MQKQLRSKSTSCWSGLARRLKRLSGKAALSAGILMTGWLYSSDVNAQAPANYVFAASSGTYTPLGATSTALPAAFLADDVVSAAIPIGFTFNYGGVDYTNVYASSNGFLSFNSGTGSVATNNLTSATASTRPLVAPLWDDLKGDATLGSSASYETTGTAGSRVFTFQWQNWLWNYAASGPVISFQAKLYEATGKIEFIYQQESGTVNVGTTLGASIGIAATATGSGNFLSLNNSTGTATASSTTETSTITSRPATGQVYTFTKPAIDISGIGLATPLAIACYGATETITVTVKNSGDATINFATNPLTVNLAVTGTNAFTFPAATINTGTLAPNATQNVVVSTTYNMSTVGTYTFNGTATVTGDGSTPNNTFPTITRTVYPVSTLPQGVNFTGFTGANLSTVFANWKESTTATLPANTNSSWTNSATAQTTFFGSTTAKLNFPTSPSTVLGEWILSNRVTPTSTTALSFLAAVTSSAGTATATMLPTDSVNVMVSTNCGATFKKVGSVSGSNNLTTALTNFTFSLGAYAGQEIMVAIVGKNGTARPTAAYDFILDDLYLGNPPLLDIGATFLISPITSGCFSANETATIVIRNYGTAPINFATNPVTVTVNVTGAATQTLTTTVNTGTLAAGASQNVSIPTPLNMSVAGTYTFNATATVVGDEKTANDAITAVTRTVTAIQVSAPVALPQSVDFTGFTDANLTTISPNWYEATGASLPTGTTSAWVKQTGLGTTTNVTAKVNLTSNSKNEWIVGPKITPTATTALLFKVAITDAAALTADPDGMQGTDDKVRVMVSTDCGTTFNPIFTFDASNTGALSNILTSQYISLASYAGQKIIVAIMATEGSIDDAPSYDFHIDDIFIGTPPATVNLGATAFVTPISTGCYTATESATVTIRNFSSSPIDFSATNATVGVRVHGATAAVITTTLNSGVLAPGATQNVTVGNINMSAAGTYNFRGYTSVAGDTDFASDTTRMTRTVTPIATLPQRVDFTGFTGSNLNTLFPNWKEAAGATPAGTTSNWVNKSDLGATGNVTAKINLFSNTNKEWIVGPKVTATATTSLRFNAAITDFNSTAADAAGMQGTDDKVQVMVSTDCGFTFTPVYTFNAANTTTLTNVLTDQVISLSSYAGQNIIVAFFATDGTVDDTPDYDFHIDDVFLGTIPPIDLGAIALVNPQTTACFGPAETVTVTIKNFSTTPLDFATNNATVSVRTHGAGSGVISTTINTGTLAPGATQDVNVGTLNMQTAGTYNFRAYTTVTTDGFAGNDTARTTRTVAPTLALPQRLDFTGFDGSNLTTLFPNWKEAAGATPTGTTSAWTSATVLGLTGNVSAKVNLTGNTKKEWIIGPKVTPTATTSLRFNASITDAASASADPAGMQGTDDKVQIMVSNDCGITFTPIYTFEASNTTTLTNVLTDQVVSLASYAGQNIIVAFFATEGTVDDAPSYDFHIDDVFIGTIPAIDLGATVFVNPLTTGCYSGTENVTVTIKNYAITPIDFSVNNATVSVRTHGAGSGVISTTLNTGTLAPGATQNVSVGTVNMAPAGTYNFRAYTTIATDGFAGNDTARTTRTVIPAQTLPQQVSFTGYDGSNLNTLFPNWNEATGAITATPVVATSNWVSSTGLGATGNTTARINLYTTNRSDWMIGPKVMPTANSSLRFRAAITAFAALTPHASGMQGTDDKVQVMVSTNCGLSFTPIFTFDASNTATLTNVLTDQIISLAPYAGQNIILAFYGSDGPVDNTNDYDFHIDDIFIGTVAPLDLMATALVSPVSAPGCYGNAQNVIATIKNFGTAPLDFATTNATVTVNVTGAVTQTLTTTINTNALNNGNPLPVYGTLNVPVGTLNMLTTGAYTFNTSATVVGDGNTTNDAIAPVTITVAPVVAGTASASPASVCIGSTTTLTLAGNTGGDIQWQQGSAVAGPFTDIAGATTQVYKVTSPINQITYYRAAVSCGTNSANSNVITVNTIDPQITASAGATRCGTGTVALSATPTTGATINWYATATGGAPLATTSTYSPNVTATTTFYAESTTGTTAIVGKASTTGANGKNTGGGLIFDATSAFILKSVVVYTDLAAGGNLIINLKNSSGTVIQTTTFALPAVTAMTAVTVPLNFNVPVGTGFTLEQGSALNLFRDTSASYPYTSTLATITNATLSGYYYFFYNWTMATGCQSARTAVVATVNPVPVVNLGGATLNVCGAPSTTLDAGNAGATYQWSLNGTAITGATSQTLVVTTAGTYSVAVTNATSCTGTGSVQVSFNPTPNVPTVTAGGPTTFCAGGSVVLTGASTTTGVTYAWFKDGTAITGATAATYTATTAGNFTVVATTAAGCPATSTVTAVTVNALPTPAITGLNATYCQNAAAVTLAGTPTGSTFTIDGVAATSFNPATLTVGAHTVVISNTNASNCTGTATQTVTVTATPVVPTITAGGSTTICSGNSVTLTGASTSTGATYAWFLNGTAITGATSATYTANAAGSYTVVATAGGCDATSTATAVTVNALPTPAITGLNATYCQNAAAVTLAGTPTGSTFTIDGVAATSFNPATLTVGAHTVVISNTNASNCTGTATQTVTVTATPVVPTITAGGSTTICSGNSVTLTGASTSTGATYAWFLNGTAITGATSATYSANAAGSYTVVATANGCDATSTATTVTVNPTPTTPTITRLNMVLTSSSATGNQWYLNGIIIPGATGQTYTIAANGNYTVVVTSTGCSSNPSAAVNITNTGLSADMANMNVVVYPNPNHGKFDVKLTGYNAKATINLYSLTGQLIRSQQVNATANEVVTPMHIENLAAGTYLLKVTSDKGVKVERLIVE